MPEKGWYSLTDRNGDRGEGQRNRQGHDLTVDELMKPISKGVWLSCTVCGARVKAGNMERHMEKVHPRTVV
jgi:hypothetical protein